MKDYKCYVEATVEVYGLHSWPDAPNDHYEFLKHPHRHKFIIAARKEVTGLDREVEFLDFKLELNNAIKILYNWDEGLLNFGHRSCEDIAYSLYDFIRGICYVKVSEDGENAAIVEVA
jgi:hypothetical protein